MGDADDTKLFWRLADWAREAGCVYPELAMYRAEPRERLPFEASVQSSVWLDAKLVPNEWFASFIAKLAPRQRLDGASMRKVLRARRYHQLTVPPRWSAGRRVFERTTDRFAVATRELTTLTSNLRGYAAETVDGPRATSPVSFVESHWAFDDALRASGWKPYDVLYHRPFVERSASFRVRGSHVLRFRRNDTTAGSPLTEEMTIELKASKERCPEIASLAGSLSALLHANDFHGRWSGDAASKKFCGTFYGPLRNVPSYLARSSPFASVSNWTSRLLAS